MEPLNIVGRLIIVRNTLYVSMKCRDVPSARITWPWGIYALYMSSLSDGRFGMSLHVE